LLNAVRRAGRASRWRKGSPGNQGPAVALGRIGEFCDPKSERSGAQGAVVAHTA